MAHPPAAARVGLAVVMVALAGACVRGPGNAWAEVSLPGGGLLRDAVACGDQWFVVGGRSAAGGETGPAAWSSGDGRSWRSLTLAALPGSYYGPRSVLYSVACANGRIAAIGAVGGGAHGNPRVSTWYQRPDGSLAEAAAPFETFGGDTAVDTGRISGGPGGFLIAGNRTGGAAAWTSRDGRSFRLFENAPGLAGAFARDGAVLDGEFVLVGAFGGAAAAWTSADGTSWRRTGMAVEGLPAETQRVVRLGDDLIATGPRGTTFTAWRTTNPATSPSPAMPRPNPTAQPDGIGPTTTQPTPAAQPGAVESAGAWSRSAVRAGWVEVGRFGRADPLGVRSLTVADGRLYAAAQALWRSDDRGRSWLRVITPRGAGPMTKVAGHGDHVLLVGNERAWLAHGV